MGSTRKRITAALIAVALLVGATGFTLSQSLTSTSDVRIVAQKLEDGRIEFALEQDGERILPRTRFFPANAEVGRWLKSSPVTIEVEPTVVEVERVVEVPPPAQKRPQDIGFYSCLPTSDPSGKLVDWDGSTKGKWDYAQTLMELSAGHDLANRLDAAGDSDYTSLPSHRGAVIWLETCIAYHGYAVPPRPQYDSPKPVEPSTEPTQSEVTDPATAEVTDPAAKWQITAYPPKGAAEVDGWHIEVEEADWAGDWEGSAGHTNGFVIDLRRDDNRRGVPLPEGRIGVAIGDPAIHEVGGCAPFVLNSRWRCWFTIPDDHARWVHFTFGALVSERVWVEGKITVDDVEPATASAANSSNLSARGRGDDYVSGGYASEGNYRCVTSVSGNHDHYGPDNFAVVSYGSDGSYGELHANEIESSWSGTSRLVVGDGLFDDVAAGTVYFEVTAVGSWSIDCTKLD